MLRKVLVRIAPPCDGRTIDVPEILGVMYPGMAADKVMRAG